MRTKTILVVDHFYEEPLAKREEALSFHYKGGGYYAGENSVETPPIDGAMRKIEARIGTPIRWLDHTKAFNGRYRVSMAKDACKYDIHVDSLVNGEPFPQWAGICYLSLPKDCQGGTSFWRHHKTGFERYPTPEEGKRVSKIAKIPDTFMDIRRYFLEQEGLDRSRWTEIKRVPMVFNRLVLFKTNLFHSHTSNFGDRRENSRLVQVFTFDEVDYVIKKLICVESK